MSIDTTLKRELPLDGSHPYVMIPLVLLSKFSGLTDPEKLLMCVLMAFDYGRVEHRDEKAVLITRGYCGLSLEHIAQVVGCSRDTIRRNLSSLEDKGYIIRNSQTGAWNQHIPDKKIIKLDNALSNKSKLDDLLVRLKIKKVKVVEEKIELSYMEEIGDSYSGTEDLNLEAQLKISDRPSEDAGQIIYDNNNIGMNTNVTSKSENIIYDPTDIDNLEDMGESLVIGNIKKEEGKGPPVKAKGVLKKLGAGEYGRIMASDLIEYFQYKYLLSYKSYYTIPVRDRPKTNKIIANGFLAKYGSRRCIELIDKIFENYEVVKTAQYPRPTINSLSQDWLLNSITEKSETSASKKEYIPIVDGPCLPGKISSGVNDLLKININILTLSEHGYIPTGLLLENNDKLKNFIEREAIPLWNLNNPTKKIDQ